jgi:type III pantothenate kinase
VLLTIDLGNTNVTCGVFDGEQLVYTFRAETRLSRTTDEYAVLFRQLLALHGIPEGGVTSAILASVVPQLTYVVLDAARQAFGLKPLLVGPGMKTGVPVLYDNPHDVGADRIVNAVAAFNEVRGAVIVVDLGTGTTFDCISPRGEYLGGAISPGLEVSLSALMERAAKLRPVEIAEPPSVIARSTQHALQSGIVFGYASLIDGMVARIRAELGYPCAVIGTGGMAPLLAKHARSIERVDPDLTLKGLRLLYQRNAPKNETPPRE